MKKMTAYIILLLLAVCISYSFGVGPYGTPDPIPVTIYTQKGTAVDALVCYDYPAWAYTMLDKNMDKMIEDNGWAAVRMVGASNKYNCHSYAWRSPIDPAFWIDDPTAYKTDGSYTPRTGPADNARVDYFVASPRHSAIMLSAANQSLVAKWGTLGGAYQKLGHDPYYRASRFAFAYYEGPN